MKFEHETFETILDRMMSRINARDKREGSVVWDTNASAAVELTEIYIALDDLLNEAFGDTASREFLIRRARERNIVPFAATQAVLRGMVTPEADILGRRFSMPNTAITYVATGRDGVDGWLFSCEQVGDVGNHFLGAVVPLWGGTPQLQSAELTEVVIPARNEEDTEALRTRYLNSFNDSAFGGNIRDYQTKVRNIEGVGAVKVTPIWQGGGTVLLTILDNLYNPATSTLIDRVQEIIDPTGDHMGIGLAPIGHAVTVRTADVLNVKIVTQLTLAGGFLWEMVRGQVEDTLNAHMLQMRMNWESQDILTPAGLVQNPLVLTISHINSRILNVQGIVDVQHTSINGNHSNLVIDKYVVPVFEKIEVLS